MIAVLLDINVVLDVFLATCPLARGLGGGARGESSGAVRRACVRGVHTHDLLHRAAQRRPRQGLADCYRMPGLVRCRPR